MKLRIVAVGRLKTGPERELVQRYSSRLRSAGKPIGVSEVKLTELAESRSSQPEGRKADEAEALEKALRGCGTAIVFDEGGEALTSRAFSALIRSALDHSAGDLGFVIGGPDGLDHTFRSKADRVVSFGRLTLPHQLVRVMVFEQIYRAVTILTGHPYHRD